MMMYMSDNEEEQACYFQDILQALQSVKRPGCFAAGGVVHLPYPALEVEGIPGKIGLPVCDSQAKTIVERCSRAPFGRGEETIYDTSVRCTWQLNPSDFSIGNPEWATKLSSLVDQVKVELGCDSTQKVTVQLYKLLLYEPGGFFKPHRDTEKVDGMFGTLVIQLLSDYKGGALVVTHGGKEIGFNFGGVEGCLQYHYTAFYADCLHEVKPITDGYRLCLVYNLMYTGSGSTPAPVDNQAAIAQIGNAMKQWNKEAAKCEGPELMAYLLEHKYSEASLSFKALKNVDRAVGDVLINAQRQVDFDLHLALLSMSRTYDAQCYDDDDDYSNCRYGRWFCGRSPEYEVGDMVEEDLSVDHLVMPGGQKLPLHAISLSQSVVVPKGTFDMIDPDKEECEEATGNEGATVERFYMWTCLLLWPLKRRVSVMGLDRMTAKLTADIFGPGGSISLSEGKRKECLELAKDLVCQSRKMSSDSAADLIRCLQALDKTNLLHQFLSNGVSMHVTGSKFRDQILSLSDSLGLQTIKPTLVAMVKHVSQADACCSLICKVFTLNVTSPPSLTTGASDTCLTPTLLCKELVGVFIKALSEQPNSLTLDSVVEMLRCLVSLKERAHVSQLLSLIAPYSTPRPYTYTPPFIGSPSFVAQIVSVGKTLGWETLSPSLGAIVRRADDMGKCCSFINEMLSSSSPDPVPTVCKLLCKYLLVILIELEEKKIMNMPSRMYERSPSLADSIAYVSGMFKLALSLDMGDKVMLSLLSSFIRQPNRYPIVGVLSKAIECIYSELTDQQYKFTPVVQKFVTALESKVVKNPNPTGWAQAESRMCSPTCKDCQSLQDFLKSNTRTEARFKMGQGRRKHLERQLAMHKSLTSQSTDRSGSPHTLIVTKTKKSCELAQQQHRNLIKTITNLRHLLSENHKHSTTENAPSAKRPKTESSSSGASVAVLDLTNED